MTEVNKFAFTARVKCIDPDSTHRKVQYEMQKRPFKPLNEIFNFLSKLYPNRIFSETDKVCPVCYEKLQEKIKDLPSTESSQQSNEDVANISSSQGVSDEELLRLKKDGEVDDLNKIAQSLKLNVSPIKLPGKVNTHMQNSYASRKRKEISYAFDSDVCKKIKKAYEVTLPKLNETTDDCSKCISIIENVKKGLENCISVSEKIRVLSLVATLYSRESLLNLLPSVTSYMINQARDLSEVAMYGKPDAYTAHPLAAEVVSLVKKYYLDDDYNCTRQSPNKNDTVTVKENGVRVTKVKRFATRSVNEMYKIFKNENPDIKIGRSKFYELRPKWVKIYPSTDTCLCVYCENFRLILMALVKLSDKSKSIDFLKIAVLSKVVCSQENLNCALQECFDCPGKDAIDFEALEIEIGNENEEITYGFWDKGDLQKKKTVSLEIFLRELRDYAQIISVHERIKNIQRIAIKEAKILAKQTEGHLVLHVDFAENWSVILSNEIQSYHWNKNQVSIFTAVCYYGDKILSFGVVSDDRKHDSAHALLAIDTILNSVLKLLDKQTFEEIILISDGAASHFKNRYQFHELTRSATKKRWLFSATGHGKGSCDGIGGLLKHYASLYNLTNQDYNFIRNAEEFSIYVKSYTSTINVLHLPESEVMSFREIRTIEWNDVKKIKGIQKSHCWKYEEEKSFISRTAEHEWTIV